MSEETKKKGNQSVKLALATIAAVGSLSLAVYQYRHTGIHPSGLSGPFAQSGSSFNRAPRKPHIIETDDGRQLLWASGPREVETGEWFDVTGSPLKSEGYQFGIGKDSIPAIDQPKFVGIEDREKLRGYRINDETEVIGYVHNGEAKAYPIRIMNRHELVNDMVGGKPVTVGW